MHVSGLSLDLNWFVQFVFTALIIVFVLLHVVKNTASKYFVVDANFEGGDSASLTPSGMPGISRTGDVCVVCGNLGKNQCAGCKTVRYCSSDCQSKHWKTGHNRKCKESGKINSGRANNFSRIALVCGRGTSKALKLPKKILYPYDEFVRLFNWDCPGFPPCGLINCGNSCFANVVLQCLVFTRPLVAYLLEKGHRRECLRDDWCFLCEFQLHVERASQSLHPFSPINILSRLPYIGGNLGHGKQEDAHEFMRFAIDTMQSVCLDEFGGEKAVHPSSQETTLIQHIFGGHLQSQVICTNCNKISNQYENMMDLTVEIHGDAASLEECLEQFTVKEQLHGENMYKCDGCSDYVTAWKRLTVWKAPNILTIALKRFQSGRFGKLNKRVTFPECLDLTPYMSEAADGDGTNIYKLYAVVVHVDMLNASFFGHYICYVKDFRGNWYRVDDCRVASVELEEVLSQGAYMLLYNRICARPTCLKTIEPPSETEKHQATNGDLEVDPSQKQPVECTGTATATEESSNPIQIVSDSTRDMNVSDGEEDRADPEDVKMDDCESTLLVSKDIVVNGSNGDVKDIVVNGSNGDVDMVNCEPSCSGLKELIVCSNGGPASCSTQENGNYNCATQNGFNETLEMCNDAATASMSIEETSDGTNPVKSEVMSKAKPSTNGKLGQEKSSLSKPLFYPGFLNSDKLEVRSEKNCSGSPDPVKLEGRTKKSCPGNTKSECLLRPGFLDKRPRKDAANGHLNGKIQRTKGNGDLILKLD